MIKLGPYDVHPAAEFFPLVEGDDFNELVKSVAREGLREPIVLTYDGSVLLDGRNRYRACMAAGRDPIFTRLEEGANETRILDYIVSANMRRRHLNPGQINLIAADLEELFAVEAKKGMSEGGKTGGAAVRDHKGVTVPSHLRARDQGAKLTGGSSSGVSKAKKVKSFAPHLAEQIRAGTVSLEEAYNQVQAMEQENKQNEPAPGNEMLILKTHDGQDVEYRLPKTKPTFNRTNDQVSWAAWTWNPVTGCLHGCRYCYARELANREFYAAAYPAGFISTVSSPTSGRAQKHGSPGRRNNRLSAALVV